MDFIFEYVTWRSSSNFKFVGSIEPDRRRLDFLINSYVSPYLLAIDLYLTVNSERRCKLGFGKGLFKGLKVFRGVNSNTGSDRSSR